MRAPNQCPLTPVILCGGSGSRLWPLSRENHPKQFHALSPGGLTMLQTTIRRARALQAPRDPILVGNIDHEVLIRDQLRLMGSPMVEVLLEPTSRNTAAAVTLATLQAQCNEHPANDPLLLILPSDHQIDDVDRFREIVQHATVPAVDGNIVLFGVTPWQVEPGYGYILAYPGEESVRLVEKFHEKPSPSRVDELLQSADCYWNSGIVLALASALLDSLRHYEPRVVEAVAAAHSEGKGLVVDEELYSEAPSMSFDHAVLERTDKLMMVHLNLDWRDLGSWSGVADAVDADRSGNAFVHGQTLAIDAERCFVQGDQRLIALLGTQNLAVVDTPDAVLIADRGSLDTLTDLPRRLSESEYPEYSHSTTTPRPWGYFTTLCQGPGFKVKRLVVRPGESLSLQSHEHRSEYWAVIRGRAQVTNDSETFTLKPNESTFISIGAVHRLANPYSNELEVLEVQIGSYLEEDDIRRYRDCYGRPTVFDTCPPEPRSPRG